MKNKLLVVASFIFGVVIGYGAAYSYTKKMCDQKTKEAVESVKRAYKPARQAEIISTAEQPSAKEPEENHEREEEVVVAHREPYEISPQEFGSRKGYDYKQLIACADGVITSEDGEIVNGELLGDDIDEIIVEADGETVYIRNDMVKCDFEVVMDERAYEEIPFIEPLDPENL